MQALVQHQHGPPESLAGQRRLARVSGFLYLVIAVCGMFAPLVLELLVAPGDATTTADNLLGARWLFVGSLVTWIAIVVADAAVSITLYLLLEPVSRALSLVTAAIRLVYSAMLGAIVLNLYDAYLLLADAGRGVGLEVRQRQVMALAALDSFGTGFLLALVFFGTHLVLLGLLFYRSRYVPRPLGILLVAAGIGYGADSLASLFVADYGGVATAILLAPAVVGELGLTTWLLVKGITIRPGSGHEERLDTRPTSIDAQIASATGGTR